MLTRLSWVIPDSTLGVETLTGHVHPEADIGSSWRVRTLKVNTYEGLKRREWGRGRSQTVKQSQQRPADPTVSSAAGVALRAVSNEGQRQTFISPY